MFKMKKRAPKKTMPAVLRILLSVVFLAIMSVVFAWYIEYRRCSGNADEAWEFITENTLVFWYSAVIVFFVLSAICALLWRPFLGAGVFFAIISTITYAHIQKFKYREAPLLPEDFLMADQAGGLLQFIDPWELTRLIIGIVFILIGTGLLDYYARRVIGRVQLDSPWWERHAIIPRATLTILALVGVMLSTDFILHREGFEEADDARIGWLDTKFTAWNQTINYKDNGFVLGFIYNLGQLGMQEPSGYNEKTIQDIARKYEKVKELDIEREPLDELVDNIIVILDETFYDPELLDEHYSHTGGDPIPNLHRVFVNYPSGYMYSPEYGGGTANVEFEVFTSLSNFWSGRMQYINSVPKLESLMSVASWAKHFGFDTDAVHAYDGTMYKRYIVYPKIGYDNFIDEGKFSNPVRENEVGYISDSAVYGEILDLLKNNDGRQMVGAVTMQNHGPYDSAEYEELNYQTEKSEEVSHSFQSLHNADVYLGEFLQALDELDEKTVVLWFGDHAAGVIGEYAGSGDKMERDLSHLTPYFVYANFEIKSPFTEKEVAKINKTLGFDFPTKGVNLPTTTPNCLANTMYNVLEAEKPVIQYLLDEVCAEVPILARAYFGDTIDADTEPDSAVIKEYQLLNYDIMSGEYYWPYKK